MTAYVCVTCGVQQADRTDLPDRCAICEDERQYVGPSGQRWTTLDEMQGRFHNVAVNIHRERANMAHLNPAAAIAARDPIEIVHARNCTDPLQRARQPADRTRALL